MLVFLPLLSSAYSGLCVFLFGGDGRATELINYEASLAPKTEYDNVKGFSCYHGGNYETLKENQKKELTQKGKKLSEIKESTITATTS
jgi:hypothetical protein